MRRISFAQRFIASLCCFLLNVPVLAQAHTIGPNGPIPVERAPLPLPAPESVPESRPVLPPVTKPVNTPMPAPVHSSAESETAGKRKKEIYYIHTDHLNTPRAITNGEQKKVWKWGNVDPFGKNAADENPEGRGRFAFNLRFPGQYYDRETGLHYNWHRDYDPGVGRYVQSDPIGLGGGLNTYGYVGQNPLRYIDSYGKSPFLIPLFIFGSTTGFFAKLFGNPSKYLALDENGNVIFKDFWPELALAAYLGGISTLIPITGMGIFSIMAINGVLGAIINGIDQFAADGKICLNKLFVNGIFSALIGTVGNRLANGLGGGEISNAFGTAHTSSYASIFGWQGWDGPLSNCLGGCD